MGSRLLITILAVVVVGLSQFIAGLTGNGAGILLSGLLMGLLPYGIWKLRPAPDDSSLDLYLPLLAGLIGISSSVFLRLILQTADGSATDAATDTFIFDLWAALLGLVSSGMVVVWRLRSRRARCPFCHRPLGQQWQKCPRCENYVCANCWNSDSYRCVDCERSRTPLLELEGDEWWTKRLGTRESVGRCIRCRADARERDIRRCVQCPRAMCTHCWDMENGRCIGCNYVMEDLSESLLNYHEPG